MVDFLRRHWETVQETLNIKNNEDFYGELQTVTTKKPIMKNVLAFIRKQQYLEWRKKNDLGTLCEQIFWPVLPKQKFAITRCSFIWKTGIPWRG